MGSSLSVSESLCHRYILQYGGVILGEVSGCGSLRMLCLSALNDLWQRSIVTPSFAGGSIHQRKKCARTRLSSYNSKARRGSRKSAQQVWRDQSSFTS